MPEITIHDDELDERIRHYLSVQSPSDKLSSALQYRSWGMRGAMLAFYAVCTVALFFNSFGFVVDIIFTLVYAVGVMSFWGIIDGHIQGAHSEALRNQPIDPDIKRRSLLESAVQFEVESKPIPDGVRVSLLERKNGYTHVHSTRDFIGDENEALVQAAEYQAELEMQAADLQREVWRPMILEWEQDRQRALAQERGVQIHAALPKPRQAHELL